MKNRRVTLLTPVLAFAALRAVTALAGCSHRDEESDTAAADIDNASLLVVSQVYTPIVGPPSADAGDRPNANTNAPEVGGYIEIFNRSDAPISLNGKGIGFASDGAAAKVALPDVALPPHQYYLVAIGPQPANATPADFVPEGTSRFHMFQIAGAAGVHDPLELKIGNERVGWGKVPGLVVETAAAPSLAPGMALFRKAGGCQDTNDNSKDFELAPAVPRNLKTPGVLCESGRETKPDAAVDPPPTRNDLDATAPPPDAPTRNDKPDAAVDPPPPGDAAADAPATVVVGEKGDKGDKGDPGPAGEKGANGSQGDAGPAGAAGAAGAAGGDGKNGMNGASGEDGRMGGNGDPGTPGTAGKDGKAGANGSCSAAPGGSRGAPMPVGALAGLALALSLLVSRRRARS